MNNVIDLIAVGGDVGIWVLLAIHLKHHTRLTILETKFDDFIKHAQ